MAILQHALGTLGDGPAAAATCALPAANERSAQMSLAQDRLVGLLVMALLPAIFWPTLLAVVGFAIGSPFTVSFLVMLGLGIAVFLALVCTAMTRNIPIRFRVRAHVSLVASAPVTVATPECRTARLH